MNGKKGEKREKRGFGQWFLDVMDDPQRSKIAVPLIAILLSLVAIVLFMLLLGKNPFTALQSFLQGCGLWPKPTYANGKNMLTDFLSFLDILAPMLLAALGIVVAMKAGLFNIGVSGQMLAAGFLATALVGYSGLDAVLAKPLVLLIGIAAGGLLGALVGYLKYRFNIHEVVSTIMFNYIISYVTSFFINTYYADMITRSSRVCSPASRLTITGVQVGNMKLTIPLGIVLAIAAVFVVRFLLDRTVLGYEMKTVGLNQKCARYSGIRVGRRMVTAMAISGVLAGLAGVTYYLGYYNTIIPKELADMGYDCIAVSLLGNLSPVGSIFGAVLVTIFQKGSVYMSSTMSVPKEIASVVIGLMLLFSACGTYIRYAVHQLREKKLYQQAKAPAIPEKTAGTPEEKEEGNQ